MIIIKKTTADRLNQLMNERNLKQVDILELCKPYCEKYSVKLNKNDLSQYNISKETELQKSIEEIYGTKMLELI